MKTFDLFTNKLRSFAVGDSIISRECLDFPSGMPRSSRDKFCAVLLLLFFLGVGNMWGAKTTIYYETFKKNTGSRTADFSSSYAYDSQSTSIVATNWKVSKYETQPSDYTGASGESHLCTNTSNNNITFSFGDISDYENVILSFGWKNGAAKGKERTITCVVSGDGGETWSSNILPSHNENDAICQTWFFFSYEVDDNLLSNFVVKFTNTASNDSRVDDVKLVGTKLPSCTQLGSVNGSFFRTFRQRMKGYSKSVHCRSVNQYSSTDHLHVI